MTSSKVYVITGAASGIGKALTERFSKEAKVFAGYRKEGGEKELKELSPNIIPFRIDLCDEDSIITAIEFIKNKT